MQCTGAGEGLPLSSCRFEFKAFELFEPRPRVPIASPIDNVTRHIAPEVRKCDHTPTDQVICVRRRRAGSFQ